MLFTMGCGMSIVLAVFGAVSGIDIVLGASVIAIAVAWAIVIDQQPEAALPASGCLTPPAQPVWANRIASPKPLAPV